MKKRMLVGMAVAALCATAGAQDLVGTALGDANLDGVVDAADVQFINQIAVGVAEAKGDFLWAADVTQDGLVNLEDAKALQAYLDGETTKDGKAVPLAWLPLLAGLGLAGYVATQRRRTA